MIDGLAGRRGDAGTGRRHRCDRNHGQAAAAELADACCRNNSAPYTSTIVFLVRKGNPKGIKDWGDLVKPGIAVITPNPKTSGGARWNYLAAWAWAKRQPGGNDATAKEFVTQALQERAGARHRRARFDHDLRAARHRRRAASPGRTRRCWRSRSSAPTSARSSCPRSASWPSRPVAVVDKVALRRGTREVAAAYLKYLYSKEGQEIIAKNYYRPRDPEVAAEVRGAVPEAEAGDHRRLRRLDQGAAERPLRPIGGGRSTRSLAPPAGGASAAH